MTTLTRATRLYREWHRFSPENVIDIDIPEQPVGRLKRLGRMVRLDYTSDKWEKTETYYYHYFRKNAPTLYTDEEGNYFIIGFIKVTSRGIDDWDKSQEGDWKPPPKATAKLGVLELISYEDDNRKRHTVAFEDRFYVGHPDKDYTYISSPTAGLGTRRAMMANPAVDMKQFIDGMETLVNESISTRPGAPQSQVRAAKKFFEALRKEVREGRIKTPFDAYVYYEERWGIKPFSITGRVWVNRAFKVAAAQHIGEREWKDFLKADYERRIGLFTRSLERAFRNPAKPFYVVCYMVPIGQQELHSEEVVDFPSDREAQKYAEERAAKKGWRVGFVAKVLVPPKLMYYITFDAVHEGRTQSLSELVLAKTPEIAQALYTDFAKEALQLAVDRADYRFTMVTLEPIEVPGKMENPDETDEGLLVEAAEIARAGLSKEAAESLLKKANPPYHRTFQHIDRRVIKRVSRFIDEERPWHGTDEEKMAKFTALIRDLSTAYEMEVPSFNVSDPAHAHGSGVYYGDRHHIELPKFSVVTALHEFRHALQHKKQARLVKTPGTRVERGIHEFDPAEHDARGWSLSLFYQASPRKFERAVRRGIILFISEAELAERPVVHGAPGETATPAERLQIRHYKDGGTLGDILQAAEQDRPPSGMKDIWEHPWTGVAGATPVGYEWVGGSPQPRPQSTPVAGTTAGVNVTLSATKLRMYPFFGDMSGWTHDNYEGFDDFLRRNGHPEAVAAREGVSEFMSRLTEKYGTPRRVPWGGGRSEWWPYEWDLGSARQSTGPEANPDPRRRRPPWEVPEPEWERMTREATERQYPGRPIESLGGGAFFVGRARRPREPRAPPRRLPTPSPPAGAPPMAQPDQFGSLPRGSVGWYADMGYNVHYGTEEEAKQALGARFVIGPYTTAKGALESIMAEDAVNYAEGGMSRSQIERILGPNVRRGLERAAQRYPPRTEANPRQGYVTAPENILRRAVLNRLITHEEAESPRLKDAAYSVAVRLAESWPEGEGFGSSDMTFVIRDTLEEAGIPTEFNREGFLVRKKGGKNPEPRRRPPREAPAPMCPVCGALMEVSLSGRDWICPDNECPGLGAIPRGRSNPEDDLGSPFYLPNPEDQRPPKAWWDKMMSRMRAQYPGRSEVDLRSLVGGIWYHRYGPSARASIQQRAELGRGNPIRSKAQWRFLKARRPDLWDKFQREAPVRYEALPEKMNPEDGIGQAEWLKALEAAEDFEVALGEVEPYTKTDREEGVIVEARRSVLQAQRGIRDAVGIENPVDPATLTKGQKVVVRHRGQHVLGIVEKVMPRAVSVWIPARRSLWRVGFFNIYTSGQENPFPKQVWVSGLGEFGFGSNLPLMPEEIPGAVDIHGYILRQGPRGGWRWEHPTEPGRYAPVGSQGGQYDWVDYARHRDRQPENVRQFIEAKAAEWRVKYPATAAGGNPYDIYAERGKVGTSDLPGTAAIRAAQELRQGSEFAYIRVTENPDSDDDYWHHRFAEENPNGVEDGRATANPAERGHVSQKGPVRVRGRGLRSFTVKLDGQTESDLPYFFDGAHFNAFQRGEEISFDYRIATGGWKVIGRQDRVERAGAALPTSQMHTFQIGYVTKLYGEEAGGEAYRLAYSPRNTVPGIRVLRIPQAVIDTFLLPHIDAGNRPYTPSYGALQVEGRLSGDTFHVANILAFTPETEERTVDIPLSELIFETNAVRFEYQNGAYQGTISRGLPFDSHPSLNGLKHHFEGTVRVQGRFKKSGFWDRARGGEVLYWEYAGDTGDWTPTTIDHLQRIVTQDRASRLIRELVERARAHPGYRSVSYYQGELSRIMGRAVTPDETETILESRHADYNWDFMEALKAYSIQRGGDYRYGVSPRSGRPEFVFVIGDKVVWEVPIANAATYVFRVDPVRGVDQQLADIRLVERKMDIVTNRENIGAVLGYVGRTMHTIPSNWIQRVRELVETGRITGEVA